MEPGLRCVADTPLSEPDKTSVLMLVTGFVRNDATLLHSIAESIDAAGSSPDETVADDAQLLRMVTDAERYPAITAVLGAEVFDHPGTDKEDFEFGLELVLDGVQVLIDSDEK